MKSKNRWEWLKGYVLLYIVPPAILLLLLLLFGSRAHGQSNGQSFPPENGPYQSGQHLLLPQNAVPMIAQATVAPTTQIGTTSYFYWIVTHDVTNARFSIPAGPFFTNIGPAALSATASIQVQWTPYTLPLTYGQNSPNATPFTASSVTYDVLRTATGTPPTGACACKVASGLASSSATDTGTLTAYTVNVPAWPANYPKAGNVAGFGPKGSIIDGGVVVPGASIAGIFTVATLPAAPATNTLAIVTDGIGGIASTGTGTNCKTGGGTTTALCRWTGTTWLVVGGVIPSFGFSGSLQGLLFVDTSGIVESAGLSSTTLDGVYWIAGSRKLSVGAHASAAGFPFASTCTDCSTASVVGVLDSAGKDLSGTATDYTNFYTTVTNDTAGAVAAETDIAIANGGTFAPPPGITLPLSVRILPNGQIIFVGKTSGGAQVGVAAIAGTPNPIQLPTVTGLPGQVATTDGGSPQQLSWTTPVPAADAYSVTTQSIDVPLTGSVAAITITHIVTMPSSGCPCRVLANWAQYMTTIGSAVVQEEWISDGTNNFAEAEREVDVNNGPSATGSGLSPVTYTNSAVVTFTLNVEVDGSSVIARAAPFHAFGLRNSRLELTVMGSN